MAMGFLEYVLTMSGVLSIKDSIENQIQPFRLPTPDGELLYAWHILPVGLYSKHENVLVNGPTGLAEDMTLTTAFELLSNDPQARLVISCSFTLSRAR